ncbi:MAG: molecular chaperone HtpG [Clostridia bacterium]|nr:molecular chaperone HtpG [Clostridia bacterium]
MDKKQFRTESKKLLDMMINSIYTHKEIFLRELISNASDAIDKRYYRSLSDNAVGLSRDDYAIRLAVDKDARTLTVTDNGCGMTAEELENNLGTIARSGSFDFKNEHSEETTENVDIIGQFGVGFYSAFMVADKIVVESRAIGADTAFRWTSEGADGYTVEPCDKGEVGSAITLYLKADTDDEKYGDYLNDYRLRELVKKYSDYIHYPIRMDVERSRKKEGSGEGENAEYETYTAEETFNSMVPLWRKNASEIGEEEYESFYRDKFFDFEKPARVIHTHSEGATTFDALLFIPKHLPYDFYTKEYKKGLQLYSSGVMIMEKCEDLLPDYFSFVKGLVDSADLSLNISREMLQHDRQLKLIAKTIEKKIKNELGKLMSSDRETYEAFFKVFGTQLKYGLYSDYGMHKDVLQDLILFASSREMKMISLKEYVASMKEEQKTVYYACGETVEQIDMLPQVEAVKDHGMEVLYCTDDVDEFAIQMLREYDGKTFTNVCTGKLDLATDEEKEAIKTENENAADLLAFMKESIGESVSNVRFSGELKNHPVALASEGEISVEMEKVLNKMPGEGNKVKAAVVLEVNADHAIAEKLKTLFADGEREKVANIAKVLYAQARLIGGMSIENPTELSDLVCGLIL